ncbi:MAG: phage shock protein E [Verrucomicrobiales bacterium]|jgi:hypothetical protein
MNTRLLLPLIALTTLSVFATDSPEKNPIIDYDAFLKNAQEIQAYREKQRVSEDSFIALAKFSNTIILDTRSAAKFAEIHVKGAKHLNFSEMTKDSLAKVIPNKETRILIYCNNNFRGDPINLQSKMAPAALNIPTFITLYTYGYKNVYELAPLLDLASTSIPFTRSR